MTKRIRKILACLTLAIALISAGCAGVGTWKPETEAKLKSFQGWADQWIGSALVLAPVVAKEVEALVGASTKETKAVDTALILASAALSTYDAGVAAGDSESSLQVKQASVLKAIDGVKTAVSAVQTLKANIQGQGGKSSGLRPTMPAPFRISSIQPLKDWLSEQRDRWTSPFLAGLALRE